jgi:multicomponent Na+:H+ antiporter subunit E
VLYLHLLDVPGGDGVRQAKAAALQVERRVIEAMGSRAEIAALGEEQP